MEQAGLILLVVLGVGVVIALAVWAHHVEQKRLAALGAFAASMGWSFDPRRDASHDNEYGHFAPFQRGSNRYAFNTMRGPITLDGRQFHAKAGDFHYQVTRSNGKTTSTTHYRFSYLLLEMPFAGVPDLHIRREGLFDKLAGAIGFEDIDFESVEFSRKFHVASRDKRFAYDLITAGMMEYLLAGLPGVLELERGRFLITDGTSRWEPGEYETILAWTRGFFDRWPRHVVKELEDADATGRHS